MSKIEEEIGTQVRNEYEKGYAHIRSERERKQDVLEKILPVWVREGEVKVHLLWRNIQLENSLFLSDEFGITLVSEDGVLARHITRNAENALKYDEEEMDLYEMREDIVNHNGLYGVSVTVVEGFDYDEQQPMSDTIDPMCVIPDPKNWRGSKMRFIGFERKVTKEYLKSSAFKNVDKIEAWVSFETQKYDRKIDSANGTTYQQDENIYEIYDHFTVYNGKKYLTTWANERALLIRLVEIEPLSQAEIKNPSKVKFPVQIHRRKPIYKRFFGASIADEVIQYQDSISMLVNLQNIQARLSALGPDKFVDQSLGIDADLLGTKLPGGRIIPVKTNGAIGGSIFNDQQANPSQFPTQFKGELYKMSEDTTGVNALAFGQSAPGSQTKAEVQTLMQNANQLLSWVAQNYMRGQKEYWKAHYRAYALYMTSKAKKVVSLYQNGNNISMTLSKKDFVSDGKTQIYIESKQQQKLEDEKAFAKLNTIAGIYLQNMKPGYAMNKFLRKLGDTLWVEDFNSELYIAPSIDEERATANLELLNNNIDIADPEEGEDLRTYIEIYKQAMDTPAKRKALEKYTRVYSTLRPSPMTSETQTGVSDQASSAMNSNIVASQLSQGNNIPSIQNVWL